MSDSQGIYPFGRDQNESLRLDKQHAFLMKFLGGPIHKAIPITDVNTVADIATGTGIWLFEVQSMLNNAKTLQARRFHGFDISDAQFPKDSSGVRFFTQDALKSFHLCHEKSYDLINARLLIAAIQERDFEVIMSNLVTLLRPNGYIQWTEFDFRSLLEGSAGEHPKFKELLRPILEYMSQNGLSQCPSNAIFASGKKCGLVDVEKFSTSTLGNPDLEGQSRAWLLTVLRGLLPGIFMKMSKDCTVERSQELTRHSTLALADLFDEGLRPEVRFSTVIGRFEG